MNHDTPRTESSDNHPTLQQKSTDTPKRYVTVVYEIRDETEWRKKNPLRYEHNGLSAVTVSAYDAIELLEKSEAEVERLKESLKAWTTID